MALSYPFERLTPWTGTPIPQNTPEWLEARLGRITASDRANKLVVSRPETIANMMDDMCRELAPGFEMPEYPDVAALRWGHKYEDQAIREYAMARLGDEEIVHTPGMHVSPLFEIASATPDFFEGATVTGQIKCPLKLKNHLDYLHYGVRAIQPSYYVQCQFESFVTGRPRIVFVSYHPHAVPVEQLHYEEWTEDLDMHRQFYEQLTRISYMLREGSRPAPAKPAPGTIPTLF